MDNWISEAVGEMHVHKITNILLAKKMGIRPTYLSMILNGKRSPKGADKRILNAIQEIISEKNNLPERGGLDTKAIF